MSPSELNKLLVEKGMATIRHIFPTGGKERQGKFQIGGIDGSEGQSLYVYFESGRFKDSATGEGGDFLELFMLKYGSRAAGIDAAHAFLGVSKAVAPKSIRKKAIAWKRPEVDWTKLTETDHPNVFEYLTVKRRISSTVLKKAKVRAVDDEKYVFLTETHGNPPEICGAMYINLLREKKFGKDGKAKRDADGNIKRYKVTKQSLSPLATLFGHASCDMNTKNDQGKRYVIVCEGQLDALSFRTQGICNAVSIPFGVAADAWVENSFDFLAQFDEIYLCFDNDDAGREGVEKYSNRIGLDKCRQCILPDTFNDVNEAHVNDYDLTQLTDSAQEFSPSKLKEASELHEEAIKRLGRGRRELQGIPFLGWEGKYSVEFRIRPKEMTIYTGYPGSGKSNILYQLVAYIVFVIRECVVIASLEEDAEDILGLIMTHAMAIAYDKDNPYIVRAYQALKAEMRRMIFFYHHRNRAPFEDVLLCAEFVIRKHGAKHFIMDSVAKTNLNIEDNEQANQFVGLITTSMNQTGAHYHVVAHARKGNDKVKWEMPGLQEIKGANAFGVETFNVVTIWRDPVKSEMLKDIREKGYHEKSIRDDVPVKDTPGFKNNAFSRKMVKMDEHDVAAVPDLVIWVNKQKVGGVTGKYDAFYDRETARVTRHPGEEIQPYAKEIYERYIENQEDPEEDPDDGSFS